MNEIELPREPRSRAVVSNKVEKVYGRAGQVIVAQARLSALKGDASAALVSRSMERTVDLFKHGKSLAGDDPMMAGVMNKFVAAYADAALRRQREFDSGFQL